LAGEHRMLIDGTWTASEAARAVEALTELAVVTID
jgi:hypothetical protein